LSQQTSQGRERFGSKRNGRLKITIILGPFYPVPTILGGAVEKLQLDLAGAYAKAGHDVTLISRQFGTLAKEETIDGVRHFRVRSSDRVGSPSANVVTDVAYCIRTAKALPFSDITVTNGFFLPWIVPKRKAGKIYVHVARFPKGQLSLYWRADRFQAVSKAVAQAIVIQAPAYADKVTAIGNPIPDRFFRSEDQKSKTILFVGRLAREKGIGLLIRAFKQIADSIDSEWKLRIVGPHAFQQGGDGDWYLSDLKVLAAGLEGRCEFVGPIFDDVLLVQEYSSAAIFVYPSIAERGESFGQAPIEAMAGGCAVIVSKLACFSDFVVPDQNALQFDHRSEQAVEHLASKLKALITDGTHMKELAIAARKTAEEFRLPIIAGKMLDDFEILTPNRDVAVATR
jgi:glycosyltransferase involved in cell wall biosynthesis